MRRAAETAIFLLLVAVAGYSVFVVVVAIFGTGHGSVFWTSIGVILFIAVAALWLAARIYRSRFGNRDAKPSHA